jgi:bifunctional DNase/RNase
VETPIEVEVRQVGFDPFSNSHVVILQDKNSKKAMPIWVGISEAQAIQLQLQGALPPRPLTHDLLKNILEQVGVEVDKVLVSELKGSTYYARIHLLSGKKTMEVDSRPSDAIALALRFHRPIFVERAVFESSLVSEGPGSEESERKPGQQVSAKFFGMTVQDLTGDLISHFDLPDAQGVLVSEVEGKSGAGRLQRGDVIMAVKGEKVRDIAELRQKLGQEEGHVVTVRVRRDGQDVNVPLSITNTEMSQRKEESE